MDTKTSNGKSGLLAKVGGKLKKAKKSFRKSLSSRKSLSRKSASSFTRAVSEEPEREAGQGEEYLGIRRSLSESDSRAAARMDRRPSGFGKSPQVTVEEEIGSSEENSIGSAASEPVLFGGTEEKSDKVDKSVMEVGPGYPRRSSLLGSRSSFSEDAQEDPAEGLPEKVQGGSPVKTHDRGISEVSEGLEYEVFASSKFAKAHREEVPAVVVKKGLEVAATEVSEEVVAMEASEEVVAMEMSDKVVPGVPEILVDSVEVKTPPAEREPIKVMASMESAGFDSPVSPTASIDEEQTGVELVQEAEDGIENVESAVDNLAENKDDSSKDNPEQEENLAPSEPAADVNLQLKTLPETSPVVGGDVLPSMNVDEKNETEEVADVGTNDTAECIAKNPDLGVPSFGDGEALKDQAVVEEQSIAVDVHHALVDDSKNVTQESEVLQVMPQGVDVASPAPPQEDAESDLAKDNIEDEKLDIKESQNKCEIENLKDDQADTQSEQTFSEVIVQHGPQASEEINVDDKTQRNEDESAVQKAKDTDILPTGVVAIATRDLSGATFTDLRQMRSSCSEVDEINKSRVAPGPVMRHSVDCHGGHLQESNGEGPCNQPRRRWRWVRRIVTPVTLVTGAVLIGISKLH